MAIRKVEPVSELRHLCMKFDPNGRPSIDRWKTGTMRFFYPVQIYITKLLLTLGFTSLNTTILWCVVGVIASVFLCFGTFSLTMIACLFLYLQIALDGCDGEIARYNKRLFTQEQDFEFFARGIYIDECCHTIINPARLIGLASGVYVLTLRVEFIFCGIIMAYLVLFRMTTSFAIPFTVNKLAHKLPHSLIGENKTKIHSQIKENFFKRIISKACNYYTNGKDLLTALIVFTCIDFFCSILTKEEYFVTARASFVLAGPFIMFAGRWLEMVEKGGWNRLHSEILDLRKRLHP